MFQDSPRQHLGDLLSIFGAGVNIGVRFQIYGRQIGCIAKERRFSSLSCELLFDFRCALRSGAAKNQPRSLDGSVGAEREKSGHAHEREVAMAPADFLKGPSRPGRHVRHPNFDEQLRSLCSWSWRQRKNRSPVRSALLEDCAAPSLLLERSSPPAAPPLDKREPSSHPRCRDSESAHDPRSGSLLAKAASTQRRLPIARERAGASSLQCAARHFQLSGSSARVSR